MALLCFRLAICCILMAAVTTYLITTDIWQTRDISIPAQVCGDVIRVLEDISPIQCTIYCMNEVYMCFMFEFNVTANVCSLYSGISYQNVTKSSPWTPFLAFKGLSNCEQSGYNQAVNEGLCFKIFEEELTWHAASSKCQEDNGRIVVLNSSRQIEALLKNAQEHSPWKLWIGLVNPEKDGIWKWVDNTTFNLSIWHLIQFNDYASSYPADPFTADCASINTHSNYLIDENCKSTGGFVCERPQLL